jgi:hypothetical protein
MKKYLIFILFVCAPLICFSQQINLVGTTWVGKDGPQQTDYKITFLANGTYQVEYFVVSANGLKTPLSTIGNWTQTGESVYLETINPNTKMKATERRGVIKGNTMAGTGSNQNGSWNWSYQMVSQSNISTPKNSEPKPELQNKSTQRSGINSSQLPSQQPKSQSLVPDSNQNLQKSLNSKSLTNRGEMGRILAECWYYWGYAQIVMIKSGKASPQQLANIREKVELAQELSFKLIGKHDATTYWTVLSQSYRAQRDAGININPQIAKEANDCNNFVDNYETANAIKKMIN